MKTFILALLLSISAVAFADSELPVGMYQLDPSHSKVTLLDKNLPMKGFIEINKTFSDSKLKVESEEASFESTEFSGSIDNFEVRGYFTHKGETRIASLKGKYFGIIDNEIGHKKTAFRFTEENFGLRIFASRPSESTTALYKEVQDIVEFEQ